MGKRITDLRVFFISLCPKGANRIKTILRDDDSFVFEGVAKATEDGKLYAVVYAPGLQDSQGHRIDDAAVIEKACHGYIENAIRQGGGIDLRHNFQPLGPDKARLCESFIIQKGDPRFADAKTYDGKPFDPAGGWGVVIELIDPELRKLYATGEWAGVSLGGLARIEPVQKEGMDEKELKAAIAAAIAEALPAALAAVNKQDKPSEKPAVRVEFEAEDPANPTEEELARHARKLALAQFDLSTLEGFKGYQEFLAKEQRKGNARPAPRAKDADEPLFLDAGGLKEVLAANEKFMKERYGR